MVSERVWAGLALPSVVLTVTLAYITLKLYQLDAEYRSGGSGRPNLDDLRKVIEFGSPTVIPLEALGALPLTEWTPHFLANSTRFLRNVAYHTEFPDVALRDGPTLKRSDFMYYTELALAPFLATPWTPPRPSEVPKLATKDFFASCRAPDHLRTRWYHYSSRAEVGPGEIHKDLWPVVERFRQALPENMVLPSDSPDCNVWLSCGGQGSAPHYDLAHGLLLQTFGIKMVDLFPPDCHRDVELPPTSHPYARQVLKVPQDTCSGHAWKDVRWRYFLRPGEALYIPPLWIHSTECIDSICISVNNFVRDVASSIAEGLQQKPLPFESDWEQEELEGGVLAYLVAFLGKFATPESSLQELLERSSRRWRMVQLRQSPPLPASSCTIATSAYIKAVNESAQANVRERASSAADYVVNSTVAPKFHLVLALDYVDDVLTGLLGPVRATHFGQFCLTLAASPARK